MKMFDLGENQSEYEVEEPSVAKGKKYYPHVDVTSETFPEIEDMKVGKKYLLMVEVKPTRMSVSESEKKKSSSMCFEVVRMGMAEDQDAALEGGEKVEKLVDGMYNKKNKS